MNDDAERPERAHGEHQERNGTHLQMEMLSHQMTALRAESTQRHADNANVSKMLAGRLFAIEEKVTGLWQYRQKVLAIVGGGSFMVGMTIHFILENIDSLLHIFYRATINQAGGG